MTSSRARASRALQVQVIDRLDAAELIADEWSDLADAVGVGPLSTPAFALAWWRHLGRGELRLVTVRNGAGELIGLAPLHERRVGPLTVLRWIGHGLGTVAALITAESKADVAGTIWSAVPGTSRVLDLTEFRHGGAGLAELRRSEDWSIHAELRDQCPTVDLHGAESVTDFLACPSRRGVRKQLAKIDRVLESGGHGLTLEVVTEPSDLPAAVAAIDPVFDAAERHRPRLHLLEPPYRAFLIDALTDTARRGRLALIIARIDGRPVAFDVHVTSGSVANAWLGRFDPAAAEWSPGHLLLRSGIEWALSAGMATIDLQLGADEYKRRWATGSYDTLRVVAAADPARLRASRAALGLAGAAHQLREHRLLSRSR
jgi:CelD/BcsL family acetyltransferase involved in cellulose biosynthesis